MCCFLESTWVLFRSYPDQSILVEIDPKGVETGDEYVQPDVELVIN